MVYVLFVVGFVLLIYGANFLVDGASSIAKKYNISSIVIGLTIVALGTSSPELVVNLVASYQGNADVAMGNILGSNVANILLILGISAMIYPISVNYNTKWKEVPLSIFAAAMLFVAANDVWINQVADSREAGIWRSDGIMLLGYFFFFMYYAFSIARQDNEYNHEIKVYAPLKSWLMILGGIAGLVLGGKWIVDGAVTLAGALGMSEALISLTIVAVGTSLPELATCIVAAMKKNVDIVVGNVIGSNIFNIFFVLGTSAVIRDLPFNPSLNTDILVGLFATILLFLFLFFPRKRVIERWQGALLFFLYIGYTAYLVARG
jgi:cation:H+ antiporter